MSFEHFKNQEIQSKNSDSLDKLRDVAVLSWDFSVATVHWPSWLPRVPTLSTSSPGCPVSVCNTCFLWQETFTWDSENISGGLHWVLGAPLFWAGYFRLSFWVPPITQTRFRKVIMLTSIVLPMDSACYFVFLAPLFHLVLRVAQGGHCCCPCFTDE